jgi:hypothetical protein
MTYSVIFEISQRIPEIALAAPAIPATAVMAVLAVREETRPLLRRTAWFWLGFAGLEWTVFQAAAIGALFGLFFGLLIGLPAIAGAAALFTRDPESIAETVAGRPRLGTVGFLFALLLSLVIAICGVGLWSAIGLQQSLAAGDAVVVEGPVEDAVNPTWGYETFTVDGHTYRYQDSPNYPGFHQTAANWGPIHNGVRVRVWSIGEVIVRLEVASDQ